MDFWKLYEKWLENCAEEWGSDDVEFCEDGTVQMGMLSWPNAVTPFNDFVNGE